MVGTPFMAFYIAGAILSTSLLILIKIFLLVCLYIVIHYVGRILYDDRLMALLPLSIYLATKMWMYFTWFIYIMQFTTIITTVVFVTSSLLLWYCFLKSWLGDAGIISTSQQLQFRVLILFYCLLISVIQYIFVDNHRFGGERAGRLRAVDILFRLFGTPSVAFETLLRLQPLRRPFRPSLSLGCKLHWYLSLMILL